MSNTCISCGEITPEGHQVCTACMEKPMNEKIEEMAKILTEAAHMACEDIPFAPQNDDDLCIIPTMECHSCKEARALIYAGYRKQSEGELADKPTGAYGRMQSWCSACGKHSGIGGIESNRHKPFCPNCGARMSGGKNE